MMAVISLVNIHYFIEVQHERNRNAFLPYANLQRRAPKSSARMLVPLSCVLLSTLLS